MLRDMFKVLGPLVRSSCNKFNHVGIMLTADWQSQVPGTTHAIHQVLSATHR